MRKVLDDTVGDELEKFETNRHSTHWSLYQASIKTTARFALLERLYAPASGGSSHAHRRVQHAEAFAAKQARAGAE